VRALSDLTVGQRTSTCFGLMMILRVVISLFWRGSVQQLGGSLEDAVTRTARKLQLAGDVRTEFKNMWAEARGAQFSLVLRLLYEKDSKCRDNSTSAGCVACHSMEMQEAGRQEFVDGSERLRRELAQMRKLIQSSGERALLE
jgi:hypothetical protein